MEVKAVFFDIDGTLVNDRKSVLKSTKEAIKIVKEQGVDTPPTNLTKLPEYDAAQLKNIAECEAERLHLEAKDTSK